MLVVEPVDQGAEDLVVGEVVAWPPFQHIGGPIESLPPEKGIRLRGSFS